MCSNEDEDSHFNSETPGSRTTIRNSDIKTAWKSKSHEKTKRLGGNDDTVGYSRYHGLTVVAPISTFLCFFFPSTGMANQGHPWGVKIHSGRVNTRAKRSKTCKTQKRIIPKHKAEKGT